MALVDYNIRVGQNTDLPLEFVWAADGVLVNLTGYTAQYKVRRQPDITSPVVLSGAVNMGGAAGTLSFTVTTAQSLAMDVGMYYYDIVVTQPNSQQFTFAQGTFQVVFTVTQ